MTNEVASDVEIVELSGDAAARAFEELARREMGISGDEFLARWDAGQWSYRDFDDVPGLVDVWMGLPLVR